MLGGYLLFSSDPGATSLCGAIVALCGMSVYTYLNLRGPNESPPASSKQLLSKQSSLSSKPKASADDEKLETKNADSV